MKDPNSGSVRDCEPADYFHPEANVDITDVDPRMLYPFEEHSSELMKSLFSEMQRRQEELEKQNEKLRQSQEDLIASRSRYYDLYDSAPVAYLIVDVTNDGSILEANSAARSLLAAAQGSLVGLPFSSFIFADDGELFQSHRKQLEISGESQSCSLRLKSNDGIPKWVRLLSRIEVTREGEAMLRIALIDLTDQMQAELARFESEQRFGFAIEATRDGIWDWNIQTGQVYYSPQWARLLGFDPTEIRPQVDTFFELIHPEDVKQVTEQLQLHFAGDTTEKQTEVRLRTKSGEYRWFFDHGKVVARDQMGAPMRMVGTIKDVTDRKKAELQQKEIATRLLEQESRLRKAQAISKIGNFHWDKITDQVEWSDELYRVYGRDPRSFKPSFAGYIEGVHPDDRQRVMQSLQHAMENLGEFGHEYRVIQPDGNLIWVHALGSAIVSETQQLIGLEGTCQDITDRRAAEEERDSLQAQLRESQKMEAIGTLAGGIAHDFNNILMVVLSNAEIALEMGIEDQSHRRCIDEIRKASLRGRELVQQILSFSRQQPTKLYPLSLQSVAEESASLLRATLPARITLQLECQKELPLVLGDATQLQQVILNLATNAMQAIGNNTGQVKIILECVPSVDLFTESNAALKLMQQQSKRLLRLIISDNGPGMDDKTIKRIFEPFFTTKPLGKGTGLGLAVVHGIITTHHGCISLESQVGQGTRFTIYLPLAQNIGNDLSPTIPHQNNTDWSRLNKTTPGIAGVTSSREFRILLIDDNEAILQAMQRLLKSRGYHVMVCTDQQQALEAVRRSSQEYDLVITDYNMPGMCGLSVARAIRNIRADLPVAVTSGFIDENLRKESQQAGVIELIAKPLIVLDFLAIIQRLLATANASTEIK